MRLLKKLWKFSLFFVCICILFVICCFFYVKLTPTININSKEGITYLDSNSEVFYQGNSTNRWADIDDISENLIHATISSEDKNFYCFHSYFVPALSCLYSNGFIRRITILLYFV